MIVIHLKMELKPGHQASQMRPAGGLAFDIWQGFDLEGIMGGGISP